VSLGCHSDCGLTDGGGLLHHGKLLYRLSASLGISAPLRTKRLTNRSTSGNCRNSAFSGLSLRDLLIIEGKVILDFVCVFYRSKLYV